MLFRLRVRPERDEFSESVAEFMQRNRLKIELQPASAFLRVRPSNGGGNCGVHGKLESLQTPCSEFLAKELRTPDVDAIYAGSGCSGSDADAADFWRSYSAYTSGYQSVDHLSDIDEFEESFRYLSVVDRTKHYYTLCKAASPADTPAATPSATPADTPKRVSSAAVGASDEGFAEGEEVLQVQHKDDDNLYPNDEERTFSPNMKVSISEHDMERSIREAWKEIEESEMIPSDDDVEGDEDLLPREDEDVVEDVPPIPEPNNETSLQDELAEAVEKHEGEDNCDREANEEQDAEVAPLAQEETKEQKEQKSDQKLTSTDEDPHQLQRGLHYRAGDEPEPIDLTHLNVEAAMMCLASKVRVLCGRANSPTLCSRTFRFRELDRALGGTPPAARAIMGQHQASIPKSSSHDSAFKIPDVPNPQKDDVEDWAGELRPSMRKLRQGMDSLCKTARLVCSVLRLQQLKEAVDLSRDIKYRRDVCFSQALTSLTTALMSRFWAAEPDPAFLRLCAELGPLASFESLLSMHGEDVAIFNDMLVAVEDLRSVEFTLILVDKRTKVRRKTGSESGEASNLLLQYHTFPLPRVTGSRGNLKVMLPVPDYVYTTLPLDQMKTMTFGVTPVLFNVGVNEHASIAGQMPGGNAPQEKNNLDNFKILQEYYRRFKQLGLPACHLNVRTRREWPL